MEESKKPLTLLESAFVQTGKVLFVKPWANCFVEVKAQLPGKPFKGWNTAGYLKIRLTPFTYRDYSPAEWNTEEGLCTFFMAKGHDGPGSNWVKSLKPGSEINYGLIKSSKQKPVPGSRHILLGDVTAIGHFISLYHLSANSDDFDIRILLPDEQLIFAFNNRFAPYKMQGFSNDNSTHLLKGISGDTSAAIYIVGGNDFIRNTRRLLKEHNIESKNLFAKAFW